ncbi:MAG: hypothetical protein ACFFER_03550, partial [Candidatus Thorarchaeota archaeon]
VRVDGSVFICIDKPAMFSPPIFTFESGNGSIFLRDRSPHIWNIDRPLNQLPNSRYGINVKAIAITHLDSIQPLADLDFS